MNIFTNWGSTLDEHRKKFSCDKFVKGKKDSYFRAVDVNSPPDIVFSWICQMKSAPYSYDKLDNHGVRSPQNITSNPDDLNIGDKMMTIFTVVDFVKNREITLVMDQPPPPYHNLYVPTAITYKIFESRGHDKNHCRIVVKYVAEWKKSFFGQIERFSVICADFIMMRRQLLNFKYLSERDFEIINVT